MKEFVLLFRMDITTKDAQPTKEQMKSYMVDWMEWINEIAALGQLVDGGNHLSLEGKVIRHNNVISDGPFTVNNQSVAGYILILANDMDGAMIIAEKCPILQGEGTSVEIREAGSLHIN